MSPVDDNQGGETLVDKFNGKDHMGKSFIVYQLDVLMYVLTVIIHGCTFCTTALNEGLLLPMWSLGVVLIQMEIHFSIPCSL